MDNRYRISTLFVSWSLIAGVLGYTIFHLIYFRDGSINPNALVSAIVLGILLIGLLVAILIIINNAEMAHEVEMVEQKTRLEQQTEMIKLLREQRNDVRNAISVATTYLQLGKEKEALNYLEFIAAEQSDEYNYCLVPEEAWATIISMKEKQAQERKIDFKVNIMCDPPTELNEMRLLPRIVDNFLSKAFEQAEQGGKSPRVELKWYKEQGKRILEVMNNGKPLTEREQAMIFESPSLSRDNSKGWSLSISQYIATEIGATLSLESNSHENIFRLHF